MFIFEREHYSWLRNDEISDIRAVTVNEVMQPHYLVNTHNGKIADGN